MRNIPRWKIAWVVSIEYYDKHPDSELYLSCKDHPCILSALAEAYRRIHGYNAYIVGITQKQIND